MSYSVVRFVCVVTPLLSLLLTHDFCLCMCRIDDIEVILRLSHKHIALISDRAGIQVCESVVQGEGWGAEGVENMSET